MKLFSDVKWPESREWSKIVENSVEKSKILDHSLDSGHFTSENNLEILDSCQLFDLRILESIYIKKKIPSLNDHASSVELAILKWKFIM